MPCVGRASVHGTSAVSTMPAPRKDVCRWAPHPVLSITSGFSNTITRQWRLTTTAVAWGRCRTHENGMHAEQIIIIFYIYLKIFCCMYLVLFSIVLYRTIVTVYADNIFLYNYPWQMHEIIHHSLVGCCTPARGKTVQKNCEVSGDKPALHDSSDSIMQEPILINMSWLIVSNAFEKSKYTAMVLCLLSNDE